MKRQHAAVLALALTFWAPCQDDAAAHGPSRQKVVETIEINAPADKVWAVIGVFKDMTWHPAIAASDAPDKLEEELTIRTLKFKEGGIEMTDKFMRLDPEAKVIGFMTDKEDHKILPVEGYSSTISLKDAGGGKTMVEWKGAFYRGYMNNDPPPGLTDKDAIAAVTRYQKAGLEALKARLEAK